jgi:hypothetical protein
MFILAFESRIPSKEFIRIQFVPHRKHITSPATKPNRLVLFMGTVAVYCKNHFLREEEEETSEKVFLLPPKCNVSHYLPTSCFFSFFENHKEHTDI